jgi:uncharacterized membrane protein YgcG
MACIALLAGIAGVTPSTADAQGTLPAGWAPGGNPDSAKSQVQADDTSMPSFCASNSILLFRARGTGESYGSDRLGAWTSAAGDALIAKGWNVRDMQAVYDAPPLPVLGSWQNVAKTLLFGVGGVAQQVIAYRNVAKSEWQQVANQLNHAYDICPQRKIIIAGYSYGALLLRYVIPHLANSPVLRQIVHVDLVADPTAQGSVDTELAQDGPSPRRTTGSGLDTWAGEVVHHGEFRQASYPTSIASKTFQYCISYDVVCDTNPTNLTPWNLASEDGRHTSYPWRTIGAFAAESLGKVASSGGSIGGGSSSGGPSSGGSSTGGSSTGTNGSGTPPPTYAETTGGVAHTWTNPSDAGGTEGPDIGSNETVQIACWVSGFRVADGNTYWYEIASSPWSGAYYVSSDAFYNNGSTSGTLSGTPFLDPAVPSCSNSGGGSIGGTKPTYSETAGGVAHTWTNPSDAGGSEGPDIASNQTVQIACWVNGFTVADGNTYWYEIASSPWNDAYYVSADAFYNNGSTSGSLIGTPFVDPAVPSCSNTGGGSTGGSKPSYAETTGSVAHTWTDYADAGGTEGPEIGSNQTVQISCWVSGLMVADGNTYWYQIGSSPWNDAYYVSADAFYNNGQTSGSLLGTPFVDPAVPQC